MDREAKRKLKITIFGILGMISLIVGISFAVFSVNLTGRQTQSISTGCLKIEMSDNGALILDDAYPMTDEEGLTLDPYTYTIENKCTVDAFYEATLNVMSGSNTSNLSKVKVALDGDSYLKPTFESSLSEGTLLEEEANVIKTYKLDEGFLRVGEKKTFNLRTWIDYDVEEISGKIENKVIINSEARNNNTLVYNTNSAAYFSGNKQTLLKNNNYKQVASTSGIVEAKDGNNTKYFYRGNPSNSISFGSYNVDTNGHSAGEAMTWKILSTNNDGSINLILEDSIGNSTYENVNNLLTSFYNTHLQDEESYIKTDSTFCKEGATSGEYLAKLRAENNNPSSKCNGNSVFTKIGLPTVDELMYAGGVLDTKNQNFYLYNGGSFLTGTSASGSTVYASNVNKSIEEVSASTSVGVRPVITVKADTMLAGAGTDASPYYVTGKYSSPHTASTDNVKPVITYARVDEKWSKENKNISISAKDNVGIEGYLVKNNSSAPSANDSGWEITTSTKYTTVNTYDNGTYYVFAKDAAGNISLGEKVVIGRVDKTAPTCSIRVNSDPDNTLYKTLTILSDDTNIDLKGYSWDDDEDITTSTRKIGANGVYKAYLTDLAGNKGNCSVTVTSVKEFYTVIYNANGGVGEDVEDAVAVGQDYTLLKNKFTRTGYSFIGWNTNKDATTATYTDKQEVRNLTTSGQTITLYAIWDATALEFEDKEMNKTYSTSAETASITPASNGSGTYTYIEKSEKNAGGTSTNYISISGTTINIAANTPAGVYTYVITAKDSVTNVTKDATYTITIGKANSSLSLNPTSGTLTYGTNGTATITKTGDGTLSCVSSDTTVATCSISGTTLTIVPKANAADGKTATITVKLGADDNYKAATDVTYTATVNRKTLTCPSSPTDKTYNGEEQLSGITCPTGSTAGGTQKATNASATAYAQTCTANSGYKFASSCSVNWKINKKAVTITAKNQTVNYGTAISKTTSDITTDGFVSGHSVTAITLAQSTTNVTTTGKITPSAATIKDGTTDVTSNYNISYVQGDLTINAIPATCPTLTAYSGTYDGESHTITATGHSGGTLQYRTSTTGEWDTDKPSRTDAGTTTVYVQVKGDSNHSDKDCGSKTITVNKKALTVTAANKSRAYGAANPTFTYTNSGAVSGEEPAFTGALTTSATTTSNVGTYDITQGTLALANGTGGFKADNYTISYTKGTLTVTKADATCPTTFTAYSGTYDGESHTITATGQSGGTLQYRTSTTGTWSNTKPTGTNVSDSKTVYVQVKGDDNHSDKDCGSKTITISKKTLTVTAADKSRAYGAANPAFTYTSSGAVSGEEPAFTGSLTTTATTTSDVGSYDITQGTLALVDGTGFIANNYTLSYTKGTLTVTAAKCATPTSVAISTAGRVTWTNSSTSACSTHQVKVASGSYANATSGVDKNSDITSATGSRSVSVIAKAPNSNYTDSAAGSATATVITITFASNDTGKGTVSPTSKNVISGATVATSSNNLLIKGVTSGTTTTTLATITPSAKTGYSFSSWSKTSGSLTSAQTITGTFTGNTYTINYYQGNGTSTAGSTKLGSSECTYGTACTLSTYANLEGVFPYSSAAYTATGQTNYSWAFYGWSTSETGTTRTYTNGQSINPTSYSDTIDLYALGSKGFSFNGGVAPLGRISTATQVWNPYSTADTYLTAISIPAKVDIDGWTFLGYVGGSSAATSATVTIAASKAGTSMKPAYNVYGTMRSKYSRTLTVNYNNNGGSGTMSATTLTQYYNSGYGNAGGTANTGSTLGAHSITLSDNSFTKTGYTFSKWAEGSASGTEYAEGAEYTALGATIEDAKVTETMYAKWTDSAKPTVTLSSSSTLKTASQTATLKCTDNVAVTAYYWGTTEPTAATSIKTTTAADINSLKATAGLSKTISSAGTYWLGCRDAAGNWDKKSVTIYNYKVENMLQNYSGSTYTTTHYTEASNATYIAPSGTTITLTSVYTIPTGSRSGRWNGYSSGEPSTTAVTPSKTNPTLSSNSTYAMWFTRNVVYFKYQLQSDETLNSPTQNAAGTQTYTWSTDSNNYITRQVDSGTATNNFSSYRYGVENIDLYNYNNANALNITKAGWQGVSGKEWECVSGCKTANLEISHNSTPFNSSTMCDISSADCTIVVKVNWTGRTYTGTFHYQSSTASGTGTVESKTAQCTVTSGSSCTATIPTEVTGSGGTYNNDYAGLRTAVGANMSPTVAKSATTVTLSANTDYYSIYSTAVKMYYPSSASATTSKTVYQNQWFSSATALATTVLASSATGTSTNATAGALVSGYSLVGFNTAASKNVQNVGATIAALAQSDSGRNATRNVYQVEKNDDTVTVACKYQSSTTSGTGTVASADASGTKTTFLRPTSTTAAGTSVSHGNLTIPTEVTGSGGTYNNDYVGVSASTGTMSTATLKTDASACYAVYRTTINIYYPTSTSASTSKAVYQNQWFSSATALATTVLSTSTTGTSTNATAGDLVSGYETLVGFNTAASKNTQNKGATIAKLAQSDSGRNATVNVYQIAKKTESVEATFYYSSSNVGAKTSSEVSGTKTTFLRCTSTSAAGTSVSNGSIAAPSTTAPYGTTLLGWATEESSMTTATVNTANTSYYAVYQKSGVRINYYNGSEYTTRTDIYRNGVYRNISGNEYYNMYLATSATGISNYSTATGPGSSVWYGLSTGADTTREYSNVGRYNTGAAYSSTNTFYTVYKFNVTYEKGSNVSSIGATTGACYVSATSTSAGGTSCNVTLPSITPTTGYDSVGWNTTSGATTGTAAGQTKSISTNATKLYANAKIKTFTVSVTVNNGTISGSSSKTVNYNTSATFSLTPSITGAEGSVTCTNSQTGTLSGNTLTVSNVKNNTTCTVTYSTDQTVLYTDGTLIINEKASNRSANITAHGAVTNTYQPMNNNNAYVFESSSQPWSSEKTSIKKVEIGQKIEPTNTKNWFSGLKNMTTGNLINLDTKNVTNMYNMFSNAGNNSSVTSFKLTGLNNWNTSSVTRMDYMFEDAGYEAANWDIGDLSNWDTSKVTDMTSMFVTAGQSATTWNIGNLSNWDTSSVTSMRSMFWGAGNSATTWSIGDLSNWDTSSVTSMRSMFWGAGNSATTWSIGDLSSWDTSKVTDMSGMFYHAGQSATTWSIGNLSNWNTSSVHDMTDMFSYAGYNATTWSIGNLSNWNTSSVTRMGYMFYSAGYNATTWNSIGTLKVYATDIHRMFRDCPKSKATLNIYSNPTDYDNTFWRAATASGAKITVNYKSTTTNIDDIIATKSSNSNVVKGSKLS